MNTQEVVVYISGPISGRAEGEAATHFAFIENILEEQGGIVFNPMEHPERNTWEEYMKDGILALLDSDCVVMLDGWKSSRGASFERLIAFELDIPIYYEEELTWASLES